MSMRVTAIEILYLYSLLKTLKKHVMVSEVSNCRDYMNLSVKHVLYAHPVVCAHVVCVAEKIVQLHDSAWFCS
jgi:hypothetical protein